MIESVKELLDSLTPDMYKKLKQSVELGKWPTGGVLTEEQRSLCLQAVIAYEQKHLPAEEQTGYIPPKKHTHCGSETGTIADDEEKPVVFK
ncbi:YeaC family protein [Eionea flava]